MSKQLTQQIAEVQALFEASTQGEWGYDLNGFVAVINESDGWGRTQSKGFKYSL